METAKTIIEVIESAIKSLPSSVQAGFACLMGFTAHLSWIATLFSIVACVLIIRLKWLEIKLKKMEIKSKECGEK